MLEMTDVYHEIHTKGFCLEQPVMLGTLGFPFVDKLCFDGQFGCFWRCSIHCTRPTPDKQIQEL